MDGQNLNRGKIGGGGVGRSQTGMGTSRPIIWGNGGWGGACNLTIDTLGKQNTEGGEIGQGKTVYLPSQERQKKPRTSSKRERTSPKGGRAKEGKWKKHVDSKNWKKKHLQPSKKGIAKIWKKN